MLKYLIKKYVIWMVLSYITIVGVLHTFVLIPQRNTIEHYRTERTQLEYDYMKMTRSPAFLNSINTSIQAALAKTRSFEWVESGEADSSLIFYNYIYRTAEKNNLSVIEMILTEKPKGRKTKKDLYHTWKVKFSGSFNGILKLVEEVESDRRFVVIEEISARENKDKEYETFYEMVFLCLKKGAYEKRKAGN
jgi:Tfp pilus assembly protein PilO